MSREIKFRCWNKVRKIMFDPFVQTHPVDYFANPTYPMMQYTGLKDKNGKEIYEGDLLKIIYPAGYSIYEVCFGLYNNDQSYEDNVSGNGWYAIEHRFWPEYEKEVVDGFYGEIIGNIYETPELLKEKV